MKRATASKIGIGVFGVIAFWLVWSLVYGIVVGARHKPSMVGEGQARWGLLQMMNGTRELRAITMPTAHFVARINHPATSAETWLRALMAAGLVIAAGAGLGVAGRIMRKPKPYGDAKFGTVLDAEKKALTSGDGLILGKLNGVTVSSNDPSHVLVVGPTRSGKGVSFIIPNGYAWHGSSVWFDPKKENYQAFAAHRAAIGDKVFFFSPGEELSHRYNPLDYIRLDDRMSTDALVVASFFVEPSKPEIWGRAGRLLMAALIGYVLTSKTTDDARHMRSVARLTATGEPFLMVLQSRVKTESADLPQWVIDGFNQFIALEDETRNSVLFNVNTALNPWNNPLVAAATATSDFDIREFRRVPNALFIGCSVAQLAVFRPIIKLLVQQIHDVLMSNLPDPATEPLKVLVMIDEFAQLERMDDLIGKLTISAGYGFRMVLVLQDVEQLDKIYDPATRKTTLSACQTKLFIRINDMETARYVSDMLGTRTLETATPTIRPGQGWLSSSTKTIRYEPQPLRRPDDIVKMPETNAILLVPNAPGFELKKIRYYADPPYKGIYEAIQFKSLPVPALTPWVDPAPREAKRADHLSAPEDPAKPAKVVNFTPAPSPAPPTEISSLAAPSPEPPPPARAKPARKKKLPTVPPASGANEFSIGAFTLAAQGATTEVFEEHEDTLEFASNVSGALAVIGVPNADAQTKNPPEGG